MVAEKKAFGMRMKKLREEKGISQGDLAEFLKVTSSCVANWEMGLRIPDINMWGKLAEYFGVSVDYLCCRSNQRNYVDSNKVVYDSDLVLDLSKLKEEDRDRIKKYYEFLLKNT